MPCCIVRLVSFSTCVHEHVKCLQILFISRCQRSGEKAARFAFTVMVQSRVHLGTRRVGNPPEVFGTDNKDFECTASVTYAATSSILLQSCTVRWQIHRSPKILQFALSSHERGSRHWGLPSTDVKILGNGHSHANPTFFT